MIYNNLLLLSIIKQRKRKPVTHEYAGFLNSYTEHMYCSMKNRYNQ
nr:MAG TPA: hypothetical protein [Caudoviricetes sp.]